ncbi:hypothetical protein [Rheinheimera sp.]|uniref:hypothetical protein n=1 Tax=Rheinheimera sp. TaxID=1869214 RepID=UPI00307E442D
MKHLLTITAILSLTSSMPLQAEPAATQQQFFTQLSALCGKAFAGTVVVDNQPSAAFSGPMLMHVRDCSETEIQIPFVVGDNHSRTWIISKTGSGLRLKHQHKHQDGSDDVSTMYGGDTLDAGWAQAQSFPADAYSKDLFIQTRTPQSVGNTWHLYLYPEERFSYRLTREGREFRVDFDLTRPVALPAPAWGFEKR